MDVPGLTFGSTLVLDFFKVLFQPVTNFYFLVDHYGIGGIALWIFGNKNIWALELGVLKTTDDRTALEFRKTIQDEAQIIAVAVISTSMKHLYISLMANLKEGFDPRPNRHYILIFRGLGQYTLDRPGLLRP